MPRKKQTKAYKKGRMKSARDLVIRTFGPDVFQLLKKRYAMYRGKDDIQATVYKFLVDNGYSYREISALTGKTHEAIRQAQYRSGTGQAGKLQSPISPPKADPPLAGNEIPRLRQGYDGQANSNDQRKTLDSRLLGNDNNNQLAPEYAMASEPQYQTVRGEEEEESIFAESDSAMADEEEEEPINNNPVAIVENIEKAPTPSDIIDGNREYVVPINFNTVNNNVKVLSTRFTPNNVEGILSVIPTPYQSTGQAPVGIQKESGVVSGSQLSASKHGAGSGWDDNKNSLQPTAQSPEQNTILDPRVGAPINRGLPEDDNKNSNINSMESAPLVIQPRRSPWPAVVFATILLLGGLGYAGAKMLPGIFPAILSKLSPSQNNQAVSSQGGEEKKGAEGSLTPEEKRTVTETVTTETNTKEISAGETQVDRAHVVVEVIGGEGGKTTDGTTGGTSESGTTGETTSATTTTTEGTAVYTAGTGIEISGNQISVSGSYSGQGSIGTVGTISSGTWHGGEIQDAYVADNITAANYIPLSADFGGDVSGNYDSLTVDNDSHTHTMATLPAHDSLTGAGTVDTAAEVQTVTVGGDASGAVGNIAVTDDSHSHTAATLPATASYLGSAIESTEITNDEILEVDLKASNSASGGQVLTYNAGTGGFTWVDAGAGGATQLSDLTDVNTTTPTNGNILMADGTDWESVAQTNITSVGTIVAGTWQGGVISDAYLTDTLTASNYIPLIAAFGGDVSGTYGAIAVTDDSHSHTAVTIPSHDSITGAGTVDTTLEVQGVAIGGDASGTVGAIAVTDDSHAHTTTTISGLDISADTNLAGDTEIVLTGDALSIASSITRDSELSAYALLTGGTFTGTLTLNDNDGVSNDVNLTLGDANESGQIILYDGSANTGTLAVDALSADAVYTLSGATGTIWTSGNDGTGSTLDADTLDGHDTAYFMTAGTDNWINSTGDTGTGNYDFTGAFFQGASPLVFEGAIADDYETIFTITDPTVIDKTITFPNITGTVVTTGDTGSVTGTMILDDTVALGTDTANNYVANVANGSGITGGSAGSEGASLTLALGALTADWTQSGAYDIILSSASGEIKIKESSGDTFYGILEVGDLGADATYTFSGVSGTVVTTTTEAVFTGDARHAKRIQLNAEYPGSLFTKFYGAGTDASTTGTMTSDAEPSADLLRTYFNWDSSEVALNYYTVAVRVTLPSDFDSWATSNAVQVDIDTESTNTANNLVSVYIYNGDDTPGSAVGSDLTNASAVADTWEAVTIDDSVIDDGAAPDWDAAGETAVIYLRLGSKDSNFARIGDIKLNYLSKW